MGYNLFIGKKMVKRGEVKERMADDPFLVREQAVVRSLTVKSEKHKDAPAFGEPTDYTNERWPSYTSWYWFCFAVGIEDLFYPRECSDLRGGHPGAFVIAEEWLEDLNRIYNRFKKRFPECEASYEEDHPTAKTVVIARDRRGHTEEFLVNSALCRFEWLVYWCNYAREKYGDDAIFLNY